MFNTYEAQLVVDPKKRYRAVDALQHSWLSADEERLSSFSLDINLKALKKFNAKRKLRAGIKAVIAANKLHHIMETFRKKA